MLVMRGFPGNRRGDRDPAGGAWENKLCGGSEMALVPIGEAFSELDGPEGKTLQLSPQARRHFTQADQVEQLVGASEADADLGFMARLLALCNLPRTNPGTRKVYKRINGPYTLGMTAGINTKLGIVREKQA